MASSNIDELQIQINYLQSETSGIDKIVEGLTEIGNAINKINTDKLKNLNNILGKITKQKVSTINNLPQVETPDVPSVDTSGVQEGDTAAKLEEVKTKTDDISKSVVKLNKKFSGFKKLMSSIGRVAFYRVIRSMIKAVTDSISTGTNNLYQWSKAIDSQSGFSKEMDNIASSIQYLQNSIGAVVGQLVANFGPALESLIDTVADLFNAISMLIARLSGSSTYTKAVKTQKEYAAAINDTANAIKNLAGFDELNNIGGSSSSGSTSTNYSSMFVEEKLPSELTAAEDKVLALASAFGAVAVAVEGIKLANLISGLGEAGTATSALLGTVGGYTGLFAIAVAVGLGTAAWAEYFEASSGIDYAQQLCEQYGITTKEAFDEKIKPALKGTAGEWIEFSDLFDTTIKDGVEQIDYFADSFDFDMNTMEGSTTDMTFQQAKAFGEWSSNIATEMGNANADMTLFEAQSEQNMWTWATVDIPDAWQNLKETVSTKWEETKENLGTTWEDIKEKFSTKANEIKENLSTKWQEIKDKISTKWSETGQSLSSTWENIKKKFGEGWNNLTSGAKTSINNILSSVESGINRVIRAVNKYTSGIRSAIGTVGSWFGQEWNIGEIKEVSLPRLNVGTNYVPEDMVAQIHEGEAIIPKKFNNAEFFADMGGDNEETNSLLQELINVVKNKNYTISTNDIGKSAVKYINVKSRELGGSLI